MINIPLDETSIWTLEKKAMTFVTELIAMHKAHKISAERL